MNSSKLYDCRQCGTNLSSVSELLSPNYLGINGPALLFGRVINVVHGEVVERNLPTGFQFVRDVHCKACNSRLGWFYEYTQNNEERYKEGKTVLELHQIDEVEGLPWEYFEVFEKETKL